MESKIIKCGIGVMHGEINPSVVVAFDNGVKEKLFHFNPNQITLTKEDFVGLTEIEAFMFRSRKENIYLTK
jgi:hypothetical protein